MKFKTSLVPVVIQMSLKAVICDCSAGLLLGGNAWPLAVIRILLQGTVQQDLETGHLGLCACHGLKIPGLTANNENCKTMQRGFG